LAPSSSIVSILLSRFQTAFGLAPFRFNHPLSAHQMSKPFDLTGICRRLQDQLLHLARNCSCVLTAIQSFLWCCRSMWTRRIQLSEQLERGRFFSSVAYLGGHRSRRTQSSKQPLFRVPALASRQYPRRRYRTR